MASCKGCLHNKRDELDRQLIAGISYRSITRTFGLSLGALNRHRKHVVEIMRERSEGERSEHGSALLARVEEVITEAVTIVKLAKKEKSYAAATGALNAITRSLELLGRLSGELQAPGAGIHFHSTKNVTNIVNVRNDDLEIAQLFSEFTHNFDDREIRRLKQLVEQQSGSPERPRQLVESAIVKP